MQRYDTYRSKVVQQARCSLLERYLKIWVFPKIGVPQNGWFTMENSIKMDDLGKTHYFWKHPYITNLQLKLNFVRSFFGGNIPPNSMTQRKILRMCLEKPTSILISLMWPDPRRVIFFWQPEDFRGKNWSLKIIKLLEDGDIWNVSPRIHLQAAECPADQHASLSSGGVSIIDGKSPPIQEKHKLSSTWCFLLPKVWG